MLDLSGMRSTPSSPSLPVVAPDRILFMGQIEQSVCKQMTIVELIVM